jgi:predicted acyl esterase
MRDGKKLAVDILKVTDGKKYPVILELTPYGRCFFLIFFSKKV